MLSAVEHLHALAAWWAPATSIALQEKPRALHTIPHHCLHTVLSALRVAGRPLSVTVHTEPIGTFRTLVHEDAEGWGHQYNLLHLSLSCPASWQVSYCFTICCIPDLTLSILIIL